MSRQKVSGAVRSDSKPCCLHFLIKTHYYYVVGPWEHYPQPVWNCKYLSVYNNANRLLFVSMQISPIESDKANYNDFHVFKTPLGTRQCYSYTFKKWKLFSIISSNLSSRRFWRLRCLESGGYSKIFAACNASLPAKYLYAGGTLGSRIFWKFSNLQLFLTCTIVTNFLV